MAQRHLPRVASITCCISAFAVISAVASGQSPATPPAAHAPPATTKPSGDGRLDRIAEIIANAVDQKHGGEKYRGHTIMQCDIAVESGDISYAGRLSYQVNGQAARLDMSDGSAIVFDGQQCWATGSAVPDEVALKRLMALRHLVAAPFMARDRGVRTFGYRATMVVGSDADSYKVEWAAIGKDSPVNLVAYADVRTRMFSAIGSEAFPALLGLPDGEHAVKSIVFTDMQNIDGGVLPTTWTFYDWSDAAGVKGDAKGTGKITNTKFVRGDEVSFSAPEGARTISTSAKP